MADSANARYPPCMGYAELKSEEAVGQTSAGGLARARLKAHLSNKGYWVQESDSLGPVVVLVPGMDSIQEWTRDAKDGKDFWMKLTGVRPLRYD